MKNMSNGGITNGKECLQTNTQPHVGTKEPKARGKIVNHFMQNASRGEYGCRASIAACLEKEEDRYQRENESGPYQGSLAVK